MSVPEEKRRQGKLEVLVKALNVATYTNKILANQKKFDPQYNEVLWNDLKKVAHSIYRNCRIANDLRVMKPVSHEIDHEAKEARKRLQTQAIQDCQELLILIDMAYGTYHLTSKRVAYWGKITKEAREYIKKWREADRKRYDSS